MQSSRLTFTIYLIGNSTQNKPFFHNTTYWTTIKEYLYNSSNGTLHWSHVWRFYTRSTLTFSQTPNLRIFQTERVCRRQFHTCFQKACTADRWKRGLILETVKVMYICIHSIRHSIPDHTFILHRVQSKISLYIGEIWSFFALPRYYITSFLSTKVQPGCLFNWNRFV